jgi:hypothetical protein
MNDVDLMSPSKVAAEYGGDKRKIQQAAQMGLLDPTVAVMAGMFIDRMRGAAMKEQQPQSTVAQDVMAPQGLMAAQAAPVQSGVDTLPVSEDMVPNEYAGGGIIAFEEGGETSPFMRDVQAFGERGLQSKMERTPGMVGAYGQPLISQEDEERMRLLQMINQQYGPRGSLVQGYFMNQSPAERDQAQDILRRAPTMSIDELRQTTGSLAPSSVSTGLGAIKPATPVPAGAPMTGADMRKADRAEMALRSAPGLTPAQSEANIAKARPQTAVAKEGAVGGAGMVKPQGMSEADFRAMQKRFGVEEDAFKADRESIKDARSRLAEDRKSAANMALIEAGLGIASGSSRSALKNIAEGSKAGVASYSKAMREIKADEKEFDKIDRDLRKAEQALKRGDMEAFNNLQDKAESRRIQLMGAQAQMAQAAKPSSTGELIDVLSGGSRDPQVRQAAAMKVLGQGKTGEVTEADIYKGWNDAQGNPIIMNNLAKQGIKTYDQYRAYQMSMLGGGAGIPGVKFLGVK